MVNGINMDIIKIAMVQQIMLGYFLKFENFEGLAPFVNLSRIIYTNHSIIHIVRIVLKRKM